MMKTINLFIIVLCFILFPNFVYAKCSEQQIHELNKLIDNINVKYIHEGNNAFNVTLYNIPENITGTSIIGMFNDISSDLPKNSVSGFIGGYNYQIFYIANEKNECGMEVLKTISLNIPVYNIHSKKEICKEEKYSDFEYCKEIVKKEISEEEFNKKIEAFNGNNSNTNNKPSTSLFETIKNIIIDNLLIIISVFILLIGSTVIIITTKRKKIKF